MLMVNKMMNKNDDICVEVLKEQLAAKDKEIARLRYDLSISEKKREQVTQEHMLLKYQVERERLQRDYDEFKDPDTDDDDVISREEVLFPT